MDDVIVRMIHAAELADSLSASRRKSIRLVVCSAGIRLEGQYFSAAGVRSAGHSVLLGWPSVLDSEQALTEAIRLLDDQLTARWREDGE